MNALLLLLLDSRAPAGAHNHSAGMEAAVGTGLVSDLASLEDFCRVRLATSGRVAAAFAADACQLQTDSAERCIPSPVTGSQGPAAERLPPQVPAQAAGGPGTDGSLPQQDARCGDPGPGTDGSLPQQDARCGDPGPGHRTFARSRSEEWALLDAELDARIPSEAARAASRQLGGGLRRLLRSMLPGADLESAWALCAAPPHHPLVLGAGVALAGGTPQLAARAAALAACAGPASAAVRLLGLDPFAVQAMLARLAPGIDACARSAGQSAGLTAPPALPCDSAPALDLLADFHLTAEVRLFAS